jgi:geranylgeranyl pyrophosphate synthase
MTATLADIRAVPGLDDYLDALEERLARTVATHPGLVAAVGHEALAAGGKRLRPALVFLATPPGETPSLAAGVAV